jgi:hypothetical protein
LKDFDDRVDQHQSAKEKFSQDIPTMKDKLAGLVALITEKHVKKIN